MKKGFTLVELLAVIVILAIIAIITIPMISNVIEKSKLGAMEDSAYGLIEAANYYYAEHMNEMSSNKLFVIENGTQTSEEKLNYKGKIEGNAKILLTTSGKVALCLTGGRSYVKKEITDTKVVMNTVSSDTICEINGLESEEDITIDISGGNSSYYNKNEIDDKLNDIRNDLSDLSNTVSSNKAAIDNLEDSLVRYNSETDSLDVYSNGVMVGSIPCSFKFDGRFYDKGFIFPNILSKFIIVSMQGNNSTLSQNGSSIILTTPNGSSDSYNANVKSQESVDLSGFSRLYITYKANVASADVHGYFYITDKNGNVVKGGTDFGMGSYIFSKADTEITVSCDITDLGDTEYYFGISTYVNKYSNVAYTFIITQIYATK